MSRSVLSSALLLLSVGSSVATSLSNPVYDDVDDVLGGSDPTDPTDPTDPVVPTPSPTDDCDVEPLVPYTDVVCLAPGDVFTLDFALIIDTVDLPVLFAEPSWMNAGALLDSDDAEVEVHLEGPAGWMTEVLATEPGFPMDERVAFVDDPMTGCVDLAGACVTNDWVFELENTGDTEAVVHFQLLALVGGNAAAIEVVELD